MDKDKNIFVKEDYITKENIKTFSKKILKKIDNQRRSHFLNIDLERSAFLIIDFQRNFTDKKSKNFIPSTVVVINNLLDLEELFYKKNKPVFFTAQVEGSKKSLIHSWWNSSIKKGSLKSKIDKRFKKLGETIYKKNYDAFYETKLEQKLRKRGIKTIILGGVDAHICCQATSYSAFARGFNVVFLVDGTASYNKYFHESAILSLASSCVVPATVSEIIERLK